MARIPSSRHALHRRLWFPRRREKPFFPLSARRPSRIISAPAPTGIPPARVASAPSGIILPLSQLFVSKSVVNFSGSFPAALFVAFAVYNTVVLEPGPGRAGHAGMTFLMGKRAAAANPDKLFKYFRRCHAPPEKTCQAIQSGSGKRSSGLQLDLRSLWRYEALRRLSPRVEP